MVQQFAKVLGEPADGAAPRISPIAETISQLDQNEPCNNAYELFRRSAKKFGTRNCSGWRAKQPNGKAGPYVWNTYAKVHELVVKLACAIRELGHAPGERVGVYGKNCPYWAVVEIAVSAAGMTLVPLYDSLGTHAVKFVVQHAELRIVFVEDHCLEVLEKALESCPTVEHVVVFGEGDGVPRTPPMKKKGRLLIQEALDGATPNESQLRPARLNDIFVIMYTSGTTGDPKGVVLKNEALICSIAAGKAFFRHYGVDINENDSVLSYLPLAHILEQQFEFILYANGGAVGYYSGDVRNLAEDLEQLKPTIFAGVPRVYSRFESRVKDQISQAGAVKRYMFNHALKVQLSHVQQVGQRSKLWDRIVFGAVRAKLLPNVRLAITGSAPMSAETNDFLKTILIAPVVQGYGLTESFGGAVASPPWISRSGHCGAPLPNCMVKLVDVPDMNYFTTDKPCPRGEVHLKGPVVTTGYYRNEKASKETLSEDGWFATGDVGQWLDGNNLQIIDRKKNLFKLSQGEYVSPEMLEQEYSKAQLVMQIFVYGDSLKNSLVAIVVPDVAAAKDWSEKHLGKRKDFKSIAAEESFKKDVLSQLAEIRSKVKFKGYEVIQDAYFECNVNELGQGFSIENDMLTPTFKVKRALLAKKYKAQIDEMYTKLQ